VFTYANRIKDKRIYFLSFSIRLEKAPDTVYKYITLRHVGQKKQKKKQNREGAAHGPQND
jgi:hypothetical protein